MILYYLCAGGLLVHLCLKLFQFHSVSHRLREIPTVGVASNSILSYYLAATRFPWNSRELLQEGYDKYRGSAFKVARWDGWHVLVTSREMIEDMRRARDDQISFTVPAFESLQITAQMGPQLFRDPYHVEIVRGDLTRNLASAFPSVHDEIVAAFNEEIPATKEWSRPPVMAALRRIICRTSNRLFVGLPLCRNPEYRDLNIEFTIYLVTFAEILKAFPRFIRPYISRFLTPVPGKIKQAIRLLTPLVQERLAQDAKYGSNWEERPNDILSWLLKEAAPDYKTVDDLTKRILATNFAAIHTTSQTFTNVLHQLAAHPELVPPLREEIEPIIAADGWTKTAMTKMRKLDSFIKESQRISGGIGGVSMNRLVLKDFTFTNGITVPAGTMLAIPSDSVHHEEEHYEDPFEFKPFRFSDLRDASETEALKHHMVTPTPTYLLFGHGRHACPGRFFAVNELKLLMSHLLLNYDVKFENDSRTVPPSSWFGYRVIPDTKARVLFRARAEN